MSTAERSTGLAGILGQASARTRRAVNHLLGDARAEPIDGVAEEVAVAWGELRAHPELVWIPPLWRAADDDERAREVARRHGVSALEQNLLIDIVVSGGRSVFRLATGPLHDRLAPGGGIDPVAPVGELEAKLDVLGATFEEAVLRLHEAVIAVYGEPSEAPVPPAPSTGRHSPSGSPHHESRLREAAEA